MIVAFLLSMCGIAGLQGMGLQGMGPQGISIQERDTQGISTQGISTQERDTQERNTQERDTQERDTQERDTQERDTQGMDVKGSENHSESSWFVAVTNIYINNKHDAEKNVNTNGGKNETKLRHIPYQAHVGSESEKNCQNSNSKSNL